MSSVPQTSSSPAVNAPLTLALSKGRIFEETVPLLAAAGIEVAEDPETSRKLILPTNDPNVRVIIQADSSSFAGKLVKSWGKVGRTLDLVSGVSATIPARLG